MEGCVAVAVARIEIELFLHLTHTSRIIFLQLLQYRLHKLPLLTLNSPQKPRPPLLINNPQINPRTANQQPKRLNLITRNSQIHQRPISLDRLVHIISVEDQLEDYLWGAFVFYCRVERGWAIFGAFPGGLGLGAGAEQGFEEDWGVH